MNTTYKDIITEEDLVYNSFLKHNFSERSILYLGKQGDKHRVMHGGSAEAGIFGFERKLPFEVLKEEYKNIINKE